jgi:hypothetical protein
VTSLSRPLRSPYSALILLSLLAFAPIRVGAQVLPDTIPPPPDTIPVRLDSLRLEGIDPDSLAVLDALGDSIPAADSINPADTLPLVQLTDFPRVLPASFETGVWHWDRDEILGARATTLAELVAEVPGAVPLRGGDYGTPVSLSFFGSGGDGLRVFKDGLEVLPLEGSTPDLAKIGLAGLRSVRVVRGIGEVRVELETMFADGARPYSLIEAGTGDLNTNVFRGTYANPRALGGAITLAMERVDTKGPKGQEGGSSTGAWVRFARGIGSRGALVVDFSAAGANREGAGYVPGTAGRKDWSIRTRWDLPKGVLGELFYSSSSLATDGDEGFDWIPETRTSLGANLGYESQWVRAQGRVLMPNGEGLPELRTFLEASGQMPELGGVAGEVEWEDWGSETAFRARVRAWTAPKWGFSLFAERGAGKSGLSYLPEAAPLVPFSVEGDTVPSVVPGPRFSENEQSRLGLSYRWRNIYLSGAKVKVSADSLFLLGLPSDRDGTTVEDEFFPSATRPGGTRSGFEISGSVPLPLTPFSVVGSYQWWDQAEDVWTTPADSLEAPVPLPQKDMPWRYLPRRNYHAAISFHDSFYTNGNLELWFDLGVAGRDPMATPFIETLEVDPDSPEGEPGDEMSASALPYMVPFAQSWFVRLQVKVVTVRVFIMWENFTMRQRNQDFPGRIQPASRSLYGVRWTMWN